MARAKRRTEATDAEPKAAIAAIHWWRRKILEHWRRGETAIARRRMAAVLGLAQAAAEWRSKHQTEGETRYE